MGMWVGVGQGVSCSCACPGKGAAGVKHAAWEIGCQPLTRQAEVSRWAHPLNEELPAGVGCVHQASCLDLVAHLQPDGRQREGRAGRAAGQDCSLSM